MKKVIAVTHDLTYRYNAFDNGLIVQRTLQLKGLAAPQKILEDYREKVKLRVPKEYALHTVGAEDELVVVYLSIAGFERQLKSLSEDQFLAKILNH